MMFPSMPVITPDTACTMPGWSGQDSVTTSLVEVVVGFAMATG